ncbi:MAG: homoserine kinase [Ardenticatenales bacterium]|nr:homoserine kinase [Ardenticatenales bacterium]
MRTVTVFAPATIANLGPGFDVLGVAIEGLGDWVSVTIRDEPGVVIESITGDNKKLSLDPAQNTAGIAAQEALRLIGVSDVGLSLRIRKGMPLGSGLGSSGASAAAAAWGVNMLFGSPLSKQRLLHASIVAESVVSGWHADNVGPSLFGGFILIRTYDPLDIIELPTPFGLTFALVTPEMELPTRQSRAVIPQEIPLKLHVAQSGNLAALIASLFGGSPILLGRAMQDVIVEPARAPLIPAFEKVKASAFEAGALACSIAGAGPTLFALCDDAITGAIVAGVMQEAFSTYGGLRSSTHVARVDQEGARVVG